ncbi:MAG: hypothetical protein U5K32_09120 [Bacteroidales bacterium]|nr:hypothetical protein [Bacteroidales bacterium]
MLIILLLVSPASLHSQDKQPRVSNVHFYFNPSENEAVIVYDLINTSPLERYEIELLFIDGMNQKITPITVFGDVGPDVQGEKISVLYGISLTMLRACQQVPGLSSVSFRQKKAR